MHCDLCIYEDEKAVNMNPLTLTRPVFELRCGIFSLVQKLVRYFPGYRVDYIVREQMVELLRERNREAIINRVPERETIFINGRFLLRREIPKKYDRSTLFVNNGHVVGAYVQVGDLKKVRLDKKGFLDFQACDAFPKIELEGRLVEYPWHLIHENSAELVRDFHYMARGGQILGKVYPGVTLVAQEHIYLAPGSQLQPGVVLNAEDGPIYISEGAVIMANACINGPAFIGKNTVVKMGAKLYEGTNAGDVCKVGGEIEETILHAYSNKQHEGFLGHAYLGEWVNLGADTNNSDLKNNYGFVKVSINGKLIDSGSTFVGLFMGDHSKSGINTMFITGCTVGVMSNVFGSGFTPKEVGSFIWGGIEETAVHELERALQTAKKVMSRRKKTMSRAQENLFRQLYAQVHDTR